MTIYFGDASDRFYKENYKDVLSNRHILFSAPFDDIKNKLGLESIILLDQTHGTDGHIITSNNYDSFNPLAVQGDYSMTAMPGVGLGIMTADCLPLITYALDKKAVLAIHAGWRGALGGIVPKAVRHFCSTFDLAIADLHFFFGPSAHGCCYEVGADFVLRPELQAVREAVITTRDGKNYFDLPTYVHHQLTSMGISADAINHSMNLCTIHNEQFFSYRRQATGRNLTVAVI